jgi:hypothetical protein
MKGECDEGDERKVLGDHTGGGAAMLQPTRLQRVGRSSDFKRNGFVYTTAVKQDAYSVANAQKFDSHRTRSNGKYCVSRGESAVINVVRWSSCQVLVISVRLEPILNFFDRF